MFKRAGNARAAAQTTDSIVIRTVRRNRQDADVHLMGKNSRQLNQAFLDAIVLRNKDGAQELLRSGAEVNPRDPEHNEAAIILAAKFPNAEIVQLLMTMVRT